jgi:hypothetical protein
VVNDILTEEGVPTIKSKLVKVINKGDFTFNKSFWKGENFEASNHHIKLKVFDPFFFEYLDNNETKL